MNEEKLQIFKNSMDTLGKTVTKTEFLTAFKEVLKIVKDIKDTNSTEFKAIHEYMMTHSGKIQSDMTTGLSDIKGQVNHMFVKNRMDALHKMIEDKLATVENGKDSVVPGPQGKKGDKGDSGTNGSPDTPKQVRDKLEKLTGDERLDISAIKGVDELQKGFDEKISKIPRGGGTSAIGVRQAFKYIAHTEAPVGNINGVNTTYTVKNIIWWIAGFTLNGEQIAQLPNFTYAGRTITFSSAIPAVYSGKDFEIKYIG